MYFTVTDYFLIKLDSFLYSLLFEMNMVIAILPNNATVESRTRTLLADIFCIDLFIVSSSFSSFAGEFL